MKDLLSLHLEDKEYFDSDNDWDSYFRTMVGILGHR